MTSSEALRMDLAREVSLRVEDRRIVRTGRGDTGVFVEELYAEPRVFVGEGVRRASVILTLRFRCGVVGSYYKT